MVKKIVEKLIKIKSAILFYSVLAMAVLLNYSVHYFLSPGPLEFDKTLIIEKNLSVRQIAEKLKANNLIKDKRTFRIAAKVLSFKYPLKSGEYTFTRKITTLQIFEVLSSGQSIVRKAVFPEGVTVRRIIDSLNSNPLLFGEIIGKIPEGFLAPSTYFYTYGDSREALVEKMRSELSAHLDRFERLLKPNSPIKNRKELLILASIIEKEAASDAEKPLIAAVFINRLKKNMKLQADPTAIYAITKGERELGRALTKKDLSVASPYNTYYVTGLPPGAICCPGEKSLEAVVKPAKTDLLYFVSNGNKGHNFSKDLKSHGENVKLYRKTLNKNNGKN